MGGRSVAGVDRLALGKRDVNEQTLTEPVRFRTPGGPHRSRYTFALGLVAGLFVAGLAVPFTADRQGPEAQETFGGPTAGQTGEASAGLGDDVGAGPSAPADGSGPGPSSGGEGVAASTPGASAGPSTSGGDRTGPLTATSQGVTASDIKLGIAVLDLRAIRQIGLGGALAGTTPAEAQAYYRFFIDEANRAGGVLGRKIVPAFTTFDPTDPSTDRRACLALTEDDKVFAAVIEPGFFGDAVLCFTEEHGVPALEYSAEPDEWYRRSRGLLFTPGMSGDRLLRSLVRQLDGRGALRGKKIGVVSTTSPTEKLPVDDALLPALESAGYAVAYRSTISEQTDQQPSQIPVEISQMRRAGVDYVIWVSNALVFTQWAQTAEGQGYRPAYAMTDINSASNDFTVQNVPGSTTAVALTAIRDGEHHAKLAEPPKDAACRQRYERASGQVLERGGAKYQTALRACGWVELFVAAARKAGTGLTPQSFSAAMQSVGPFDFPYFAPGAFTPGKFGLADQVRPKTYSSGCRCWMPSGDFGAGAPR